MINTGAIIYSTDNVLFSNQKVFMSDVVSLMCFEMPVSLWYSLHWVSQYVLLCKTQKLF